MKSRSNSTRIMTRAGAQQRGSNPPQHAFTVVELMVVIAIVAVLCALLFPVIARVREKGKITPCLNNLKQISLAVTLYAQDFEDRLPTLGTLSENRGRWMWQVRGHIQNPKVFTCAKTPNSVWDGTQWSCHTSYGWAEHLAAKTAYGSTNVLGYLLSEIAQPSDTIMLGDTGYEGPDVGAEGWVLNRHDPRDTALTSSPRPGFLPQFRHQSSNSKAILDTKANIKRQLSIKGLAVFGFVDGHAKTLNVAEAFATGTTENGLTLTNADAYLLWNRY